MFRILAVMGLLFVAVTGVGAQDETAEECSAAADALTVIADILAEPDLSPLELLKQVYETAQEAIMRCQGLSFTSEEEGRQPVLGPIALGEGLWRATVNTSGYFIAAITPLDGDCAARGFGGMFLLSPGQGDNAQSLIESSGCEALIEISNVTASWTLEFEQLR